MDSILRQAGLNPEKFVLGTLCRRGHDWNGTGKSLRHRSKHHTRGAGNCIECSGIKNPGAHSRSAEQRFWLYVKKIPGENTCWEWQKFKNPSGHGIFGYGGAGRTILAHRYGYEVQNGPIPDGLHVLHKCDNPSCVRGDHLFLGTNKENVEDKVRKGRQQKGSENWSAILTETQVLEIRQKRKAFGTTHKDLAAEYGVAPTTISEIVNYRKWKHLI